MVKKRNVLDWKPWMTVALVFSGIVAVATYVGPRPAYAVGSRLRRDRPLGT